MCDVDDFGHKYTLQTESHQCFGIQMCKYVLYTIHSPDLSTHILYAEKLLHNLVKYS